MAEGSANRRINGGATVRCVLHIIPMTVPLIVTTANGPAITHFSDSSLVNASKPDSSVAADAEERVHLRDRGTRRSFGPRRSRARERCSRVSIDGCFGQR
jgi:hypothetical protein